MKRKIFLVMILIWLICNANQCKNDDCQKQIIFVNNSSRDVYIHGGSNINPVDTLSFSSWFPNPIKNPYFYEVKSGKSNNNAAGIRKQDCLETKVAQGRVFIYVFDAEVLETISWETIGKEYMVLKTYHPTIEEMEKSNWTITYTGE